MEVFLVIHTFAFGIELSYPSVANALWLISYVPLFAGLYMYIQLFRPALSKQMFRIATIFSLHFRRCYICPFGIRYCCCWCRFSLSSRRCYVPRLDILSLSLGILGLLVFTLTRLKGSIAVAWLFISAATLMNAIGDMLLTCTNLQGTYYRGHPLELLFHWGYILFLLAFYSHMTEG